jgi:hypothetical protein
MGMDILNSHLLRPSPAAPDGQSALVVKLGVIPSRSRLITGSQSLSPGDSTTGWRPQCWDGSLTPSQLPIYSGARCAIPSRNSNNNNNSNIGDDAGLLGCDSLWTCRIPTFRRKILSPFSGLTPYESTRRHNTEERHLGGPWYPIVLFLGVNVLQDLGGHSKSFSLDTKIIIFCL